MLLMILHPPRQRVVEPMSFVRSLGRESIIDRVLLCCFIFQGKLYTSGTAFLEFQGIT